MPSQLARCSILALFVSVSGCGDDARMTSDFGVRPDASGLDGGGTDGGGMMGECTVAADCPAPSSPCLVAICAAGSCAATTAEDGVACEDGDFCTVGETCTGGTCRGGEPNDCGMTATACNEVVCDSAAEACTTEPTDEGLACPAASLCDTGICNEGVCTGGMPRNCSSTPTDECEEPFCDPADGVCKTRAVMDGTSCDDGNLCTTDDSCTAGACGSDTMVDCSEMDSICAVGTCNPADGTCGTMAQNEGVACSVGCELGGTCSSGMCTGGTEPACSLTTDGCCPSACSSSDDVDCDVCPGEVIGTNCVYAPSIGTSLSTQSAALSACQALGTGWGLCSGAVLCDPATETYLIGAGADCSAGVAGGACGTSANIYVHVDGTSPYYLRSSAIPGCITSPGCTNSVSESCGFALCCLGI
ncbi:MAG: hypothetical protein JJ863_38335 [Deltaproteobacteria bacterium]|nr:hypothetical protein [Deltaproteobacteria bacterium]